MPDSGVELAGRVSVLVADDVAAVRTAIADLVATDAQFYVIAEAPDAPAAMDAARVHQPDLLVLDLHMPGDGHTVIELVKDVSPRTRVVACSSFDDDGTIARARSLGVDGYVVKGRDSLMGALRRVAALTVSGRD
jgi:DNA-binding NarL/FixJ family response regulator